MINTGAPGISHAFLHLRFTTILQDGCIVSHILQMETCGLREVTRPVNSSTQPQAQPCLTSKPSFSHPPPPLTTTQSYPCPLPCDWQGDPSPSRTGSLKMNVEFSILPPTCRGQSARVACCASGCTTSPSWGGRDGSSLPSFRQDEGSYEGSLCLQSAPTQSVAGPGRTTLESTHDYT